MNNEKLKKTRKHIINILILIILISLTFIALEHSNKELNFNNIKEFILSSNPYILSCAIICMLAFILFEGLSIHTITNHLGHKTNTISCIAYSASDIYYSAITPSASGGQPASAYYMVKDGIDVGTTTFSLLFNLIAYTAAILVIGIFTLAIKGSMLLEFNTLSKVLVIIGLIAQIILIIFFIVIMRCHNGVLKWGNKLITFLKNKKIIKNENKWQTKLSEEVEKYALCFIQLKGNKMLFIKALILNILQRSSQLLITCFVCLAAMPSTPFLDVFALQAYVLIGYNSIPLPGGVGAFELLYMNIYGILFSQSFIVIAMMITRTISYYICMILSGIITLIYHFYQIKHNKESIRGIINEK